MMKNLALFLLFVATAASTNAQSVTRAGDGKLITRFDVSYANRLYETKIWKAGDYVKGAWSESNKMGILGDCSPEVVDNPDQNGINEMTRAQLEAISDALMELQNQGKNPLALPEIGYTAIQKRREEEEKK
jgi:hypothetical protein